MSEQEKDLSTIQLILLWIREGVVYTLRCLAWSLVFLIAVAAGVYMTYVVANTACIEPVKAGDPAVCVFTDSSFWFK